MKYLIVLFLFLSGCASVSDYRQGCLDGTMESLRLIDPNLAKFLDINSHNEDEMKNRVDTYVCTPLEEKRNQKKFDGNIKNR